MYGANWERCREDRGTGAETQWAIVPFGRGWLARVLAIVAEKSYFRIVADDGGWGKGTQRGGEKWTMSAFLAHHINENREYLFVHAHVAQYKLVNGRHVNDLVTSDAEEIAYWQAIHGRLDPIDGREERQQAALRADAIRRGLIAG